QQLTHAALTTMLTHVKYPTLASICLTESHTALHVADDDKKFNEMLKKHANSVSQAVRSSQKRNT
ncbi:hypothetical protein, partial [Shigella sonnei]|uniref:hypothetical protein n=1 Tax=Shigella sonnei TaxID=624 RepID=UPI00097DA490